MTTRIESGFAQRFRLGLQGRCLKETALVYFFNITVMLFFYVTSVHWIRFEDSYFEFFPVVGLVLVGFEYILTTVVIQRSRPQEHAIERRSRFNQETRDGRRRRSGRDWAVRYMLGTIRLPCNLQSVLLTFIGMTVLGVFYLGYLSTITLPEVTRTQDGSVVVSIHRYDPDLIAETVWAVVKPENRSTYYLTKVDTSRGSWTLSITNRQFLQPDDRLLIEYFVNPTGRLTPDILLTTPPDLKSEPKFAYLADIKNQKIETSYFFLRH